MITNKTQKNPKKYSCDKCNFLCSNKKDYNRHLLTAKHRMLTNTNEKSSKGSKVHICDCGKEYKHASLSLIHI